MNIEVSRKKLDLSSAIAEGDIRVLLMVLVHMTGDERCGYGQSGPVFFMPGGPGVGVPLRCVVAEGIAILINVASAACSTKNCSRPLRCA